MSSCLLLPKSISSENSLIVMLRTFFFSLKTFKLNYNLLFYHEQKMHCIKAVVHLFKLLKAFWKHSQMQTKMEGLL